MKNNNEKSYKSRKFTLNEDINQILFINLRYSNKGSIRIIKT